jgi:hypothetical protein
MAITRVNEFAAEMLRRIERVKGAANLPTNHDVGQDAGNEEMVRGGGLKKSRDGLRKEAIVNDFLLNFAARVTLYVYEQTLVKRERDDMSANELDKDGLYEVAKDDRLVTEEALQPDIQTLREYFDVFKNTNGLPNYSPTATSTLVFSELAKLICETLNSQAAALDLPAKYLHYYELLFPDFPYKKFTSAAGSLGLYAPHEFFWGSNGRPIPVLACLDARRTSKEKVMFPPHVFLTEEERAKGVAIQITREDLIRLRAHSREADDYFKAIHNRESVEIQNEKRALLVERLKDHSSLSPLDGYLYTNDNKTLVLNGFFKQFDLKSSFDLANFIYENARPHEWKSLVKCIDDQTLFDLMLPKMADGKTPDRSVLCEGKFDAFVETHSVYRQNLKFLRYNSVAFILLAECFRRQRASEPYHTGSLTQQFEGVPGVTTRTDKTDAVEMLMDLCASPEFNLNQPLEYLKKRNLAALDALEKLPADQQAKAALETQYKEISESVITSGRLSCLTKKMVSLCNSILAQNAVVGNKAGEASDHPDTYNLESLVQDAGVLCRTPRSQWCADIIKGKEKLIASYVTSRGGFNQCLAYPGHYRKDDDDFNRAMIYLFSEFYTPARDAEEPPQPKPETQSTLGWMFSAVKSVTTVLSYTQKDKTLAVEDWKEFLRTREPVNQFYEWCVKGQKIRSYDVMRNMMVFNSKTNALLTQANTVVAANFLVPIPEATASVLKM